MDAGTKKVFIKKLAKLEIILSNLSHLHILWAEELTAFAMDFFFKDVCVNVKQPWEREIVYPFRVMDRFFCLLFSEIKVSLFGAKNQTNLLSIIGDLGSLYWRCISYFIIHRCHLWMSHCRNWSLENCHKWWNSGYCYEQSTTLCLWPRRLMCSTSIR